MTTSKDIEREAEESRAQLSSTLEQLRERLTPGQLLDEVMSGSSAGASAFVKNLGTTVRDNPVPSVLIGAGILMMMTGTTGLSMLSGSGASRGGRSGDSGEDDRYDEYATGSFRSYQDDGRDRRLWGENGSQAGSRSYAGSQDSSRSGDEPGLLDRAGDAIGNAASSVKSAASGAASRLSSAASSVAGAASNVDERASDAWDSTSDAASRSASSMGHTTDQLGRTADEWSDKARHFTSDMTDQVSGAFRTATDRTMEMNRQMRGTVSHMMDEQPLLMGVVGLAIGAALGAILPSTRVENQLMGDTADRVRDTATGFASEQYEHAKGVAGEVLQEVRQEAEAQGLSVDAAKDKARDLAGEIGNRVQAVASKAQDAVADRVPEAAGSESQGAGQRASGAPGGAGEAGARAPGDPVHRRDDAKDTGAAKPGGVGTGSASAGAGANAGAKGPSPAAAQPSVVSTPPTGPGTSAGSTSPSGMGSTPSSGPGAAGGGSSRQV